jgi:MFS family permease
VALDAGWVGQAQALVRGCGNGQHVRWSRRTGCPACPKVPRRTSGEATWAFPCDDSRAVSATVPRTPETQPRRRSLAAFRHRNHRLLLAGVLASSTGSWIQSLAQAWLVLQLTHSALMVGTVLAVQHLPALFALPLGHPLVVRHSRRHLLQVARAASMLPSILLLVTVVLHATALPMVLIAALAQGAVQVVETPTRQSLLLEVVGREDLVKAMNLNFTIGNLASVIGPAVAGVLISTIGLPVCFLVNVLANLAVITATALIRDLPSLLSPASGPGLFATLTQGARYARCDPVVGPMLLLTGILALLATNRLTVLLVFAEGVLDVGASGFGFLTAALGLGTLTAGLALPLLPSRSGRRQFWIGLAWPLFLLGFAASRSLPLSIALLFLAGICQSDFFAGASSRLQAATPEQLRGSVIGLYSQLLLGISPIRAIQAGALIALFGAPVAVAIGAGTAGLAVLCIRLLQPAAFTFELPD